MSKGTNKMNILSTIVGLIIFVGLILLIMNVVGGTFFGDNKKGTAAKEESRSSYSDPVSLGATDGNLDAKSFADKYAGEWIAFDGVISSTVKNKDAPYPYSVLYMNDKSLMMLQITAIKSTFDDSLQSFATAYRPESARPVKVVAKVNGYSEASDSVQLESKVNIDGKTPSVMAR